MIRSAAAVRRAAIASACLLAIALAAAMPARPKVGHVFIILLENESFARTFGPNSQAPYLAKTLPAQGALLRQYYGVGHFSLDNYLALISGQAPNDATQLDCPKFTDFVLASPTLDANGQALGKGCVYPAIVPMIGDQLDKAGKSWKGYMQDLGNDSAREVEACGHPVIGETDPTTHKEPGDQYATKHNPFYYFHSFIDDKARCAARVVNLRHLTADLAKIESTPLYSFITPNLCDDGHDSPCVDHAPGGLVQADGFLKKWVPVIMASPAFRKDGVLIITFDEASAPGSADSSACCGEQGLPGQSRQAGGNGPGGGVVGAVVLSPFVKPGTVSDVPYNHYSLLRWTEDLFGVPHLGYAAAPGLVTFGEDVFGK